MIAFEQCVLHGTGWYPVGLDDKGPGNHGNDEGHHQGLAPFAGRALFLFRLFCFRFVFSFCHASLLDFEDRQERLLRDIHAADPFHAFLAFLLLFKQLALPRNVAAVTFGRDILA